MGTLRTCEKRRYLLVDLIEGLSFFRIEGQANYCTIGICPLSVFDREKSKNYVGLYLRFGDVVEPGKSQP